MNKDESVNSREENLNIICMEKEPPGNKAVLGRVAPNLNLSVLSLSSANHPRIVIPQPGLSSAAPEISESQKSVPENSKKSAVRSDIVGKSGNTKKSLENIFPANPASESPTQKQQINVHHANIEGSSQSTIVTPNFFVGPLRHAPPAQTRSLPR